MLACFSFSPIYAMVLLGVAYSVYGVTIWPSVATVVQHEEWKRDKRHPGSPHKSKLVGTAFGVSTSALNTALTLTPLIAAQIRISGGSFLPVEMFFVGLAMCKKFK